MKIVFFQNIVSIHFAPFLKELSNSYQVSLFVENYFSQERLNQGWETSDIGNTKLYVDKDSHFIKNFIDENEKSIYVVSGLHSIRSSRLAFNYGMKKKRIIGIISEGFKSYDFKFFIRIVRLKLLYLKYSNKIKFILAMGDIGTNWYLRAGFSEKVVFSWSYFIDNNKHELLLSNKTNKNFTLLFVGQLNKNKRILDVISVVKDIQGVNLKIIGSGIFKSKVKRYSDNYENIQYLGNQKNSKVFDFMNNSDLLILVSKHDGWGAVVNESLHVGTPVICTSTCGSGVLLGDIRGERFNWSKKEFKRIILKWKSKKNLNQNRNLIQKWSKKISPEYGKDYFVDILNFTLRSNNENIKFPQTPWLD